MLWFVAIQAGNYQEEQYRLVDKYVGICLFSYFCLIYRMNMPTTIKFGNFNVCIVINSLVWFVIAYYFVVFSVNLFSILLAKFIGFDAELFFYGFLLSGKKWSTDDIMVVFLFGNAFSLLLAITFERLYKNQRRYRKKRKIFFLWVYIISLTWFMGNVIVGAIFNFGIGAAFRAMNLPFVFRVLLAVAAVFVLFLLGRRAQMHLMVSANLYYPVLPFGNIGNYFKNQITLPAFFGILIILLFKIPYLDHFQYMDLYILLPIAFFIGGLFLQLGNLNSIEFKSRSASGARLKSNACELFYIPILVLFLVLIIIRIGLRNGVAL
jgi:hypothetical protein